MTTADFALKTIVGWGIMDTRVLKQPAPAKQTTLGIIDQLDANRKRSMNLPPPGAEIEHQGYITSAEPESKELIRLENPWHTGGPVDRTVGSAVKAPKATRSRIPKPPPLISTPAPLAATPILTNAVLPYKKRVTRGFR